MTPQQFLTEFGSIASAPNGMQKLREMVLQLAFSGRLVSQDGESVQSILDSISEQAAQYSKDETRRRLLRTVKHHRLKPFDLPQSWSWLNLSEIGHHWGQTVPESDFTYIDVAAIDNGKGVIKDSVEILKAVDAPSRARKKVVPGTVIYSTVRPYLLNIAVVEQDYDPLPIASTAFAVIHPWDGVLARYLHYWLRSPFFVAFVEQQQTGTAYPAINDDIFFSAPFPLPPLAEQKRIVAKVDELMALCDRLEALQNQRKSQRSVLTKELLGRLAQGDADDVQKCLQNLSHLVTDADQVPEIRKAILSLAVQGKLVEKTGRHFHSVSRVIASQKIRTTLSLPVDWKFDPLDRVAEDIIDCPHSTPHWTESGKVCVRTSQFSPGRLNLGDSRYVSEETFNVRVQRLKPQEDDILYSREGGILGVACRVPPKVEICLGQRMMLIRPSKLTLPEYLEMVLNSPLIVGIAKELTTGAAAPRVNVATVKAYPIPLPPLTEQKHIVAKVDQFMALCDTLEAKLRKASEVQEQLAASAVAALTGIQTQEKETMKAPKTELVARLKLGKKPSTKDHAPLASLLVRHNNELSPNALLQHSSLDIDGFYRQLKLEMNHGWIVQPEVPSMKVEERR